MIVSLGGMNVACNHRGQVLLDDNKPLESSEQEIDASAPVHLNHATDCNDDCGCGGD